MGSSVREGTCLGWFSGWRFWPGRGRLSGYRGSIHGTDKPTACRRSRRRVRKVTYALIPVDEYFSAAQRNAVPLMMHGERERERARERETNLTHFLHYRPKFHFVRHVSTRHVHFGCVELVEQHGSTRSTRRTCRDVTWRAKWNLGFIL